MKSHFSSIYPEWCSIIKRKLEENEVKEKNKEKACDLFTQEFFSYLAGSCSLSLLCWIFNYESYSFLPMLRKQKRSRRFFLFVLNHLGDEILMRCGNDVDTQSLGGGVVNWMNDFLQAFHKKSMQHSFEITFQKQSSTNWNYMLSFSIPLYNYYSTKFNAG